MDSYNTMPNRPNILFLMSDEHRPDVLGYAGDPVVRTPVLDELARTGVVFENAYTPSPICIPSRQCMAAGQLPRTCGVELYGQDLPPFSMTFARRLAQYGYASACCGKLHHDGPDQMQGWSSRYGGDTQVEPRHMTGRDVASWSTFRHPSSYRSRDDAGEIMRAGAGRGRFTQDRDRYALAGFEQFVEHHYLDAYADKPSPDQPALLMLSFNRPHYPYLTTEEKLFYYLNRVTPFIEDIPFEHPFLNAKRVRVGEDVTERDVRKATAAYYGMIEEIDEDYGRAIDKLRHVGQDVDDWWIIYTSDHGEMLGQHGVWEKQKFYEASARVPLLIRPPKALREAWGIGVGRENRGKAGRIVRQNVNLCDLFATICEMAGVALPEEADTVRGAGLDSRSLLPLMRDPDAAAWDNETISQFGGTNLMIKQGELKYQFYDRPEWADHAEVLFDLAADPTERRNLIAEPRYAEQVSAFRQRCGELGFGPNADSAYRNAGYEQARALQCP